MKYFEINNLRDEKPITMPETLMGYGYTDFILKFSPFLGSHNVTYHSPLCEYRLPITFD